MTEHEPGDHSADLVRPSAQDSDLAVLRAKVAATAAVKLRSVGQLAQLLGHLAGKEGTPESSAQANGDDALVGVGVLTQIGADLLDASGALLSGTNHYAGAALLRQIVEVEYLTWAFANRKRDAAVWLNSTREDRRQMFTPSGLRNESDGQFLSADYGHHCEQGGHPVPRAIPLLDSTDRLHSQLLLVDLLLHGWRTTDNVATWMSDRNAARLLSDLRSVQGEFAGWGRLDPLYAWAVRQGPNVQRPEWPKA